MDSPRAHVLIYEPKTVGHHLGYLEQTAEAFLGAGFRVSVAIDNRMEKQGRLHVHLREVLPRVEVVALYDQAGEKITKSAVKDAARCLEQCGADFLFFNCFDEVASGVLRRAAVGWMPPQSLRGKMGGIYIRPRCLDRNISSIGEKWKRTGFNRLQRGGWISFLLLLNEDIVPQLQSIYGERVVRALPDPWRGNFQHSRVEARRRLGLPPDCMMILHYGTASRRKGLPLVLEAVRQLPEGAPVLLVCAGEAQEDPELKKQMTALAGLGRLQHINRYVSTEEEEWLFCASDVVALAYQGHYGSSGVLSRAAAAGKPVVASDEGLVGWRINHYGLGLLFKTGDAGALAGKLQEMLAWTAEQKARRTECLRQYAEACTSQNFQRTLAESLLNTIHATRRSNDRA